MNKPTLSFKYGFDARDEFEAEQKGFIEHVKVTLPDGKNYEICFYDPIRLKQDIERGVAEGHNCIAEPGLIVILTVTRPSMEKAVEELYQAGYFTKLKSL
jgi:hypothetical protein